MNSIRPLAHLAVDGLYLALYTFSDPHTPDNFNWRLYLHESRTRGGILYQIETGDDSNAYHRHTKTVFSTVLLVGLIRIATIDPDQRPQVDQIIRGDESRLSGSTSKLWATRACERLRVAQLIWYPAWLQLEDEVVGWGNAHAASAIENKQPRPLCYSRVAGLISNGVEK